MRNQFRRPFFLALIVLASSPLLYSGIARGDDVDDIDAQEASEAKAPLPKETWATEVQSKYTLTDAQMKTMTDAGFQGPQLAIAAELSKASGKPIEDIVRMRTTEKSGWGKIAKELGLPPGTIGKSVAGLRHDLHEKKLEKREEKREAKLEKREEKRERREQKREQRRDRQKNPK